ncbi:hypothetical protein CRENBAI_011490 [Crenichthys baileyi]|uniref:Uncharacterized protein n=1 Tax=Crenichthys baileyi TaxID=28760 RepID=A0AAV9QY52_9TELE
MNGDVILLRIIKEIFSLAPKDRLNASAAVSSGGLPDASASAPAPVSTKGQRNVSAPVSTEDHPNQALVPAPAVGRPDASAPASAVVITVFIIIYTPAPDIIIIIVVIYTPGADIILFFIFTSCSNIIISYSRGAPCVPVPVLDRFEDEPPPVVPVPVLVGFEDKLPPLYVPVSEGFEDEPPPVVPVPVLEGFEDHLPPAVSFLERFNDELPPVPVLERFEDELPPLLKRQGFHCRSSGLRRFLQRSPELHHGCNLLPRVLQSSTVALEGPLQFSAGFLVADLLTRSSEVPLRCSAGLQTTFSFIADLLDSVVTDLLDSFSVVDSR